MIHYLTVAPDATSVTTEDVQLSIIGLKLNPVTIPMKSITVMIQWDSDILTLTGVEEGDQFTNNPKVEYTVFSGENDLAVITVTLKETIGYLQDGEILKLNFHCDQNGTTPLDLTQCKVSWSYGIDYTYLQDGSVVVDAY